MGRGYFNPSIKRVNPSVVAYNNSIKNATKQKPQPKGGNKVYNGRAPGGQEHPR